MAYNDFNFQAGNALQQMTLNIMKDYSNLSSQPIDSTPLTLVTKSSTTRPTTYCTDLKMFTSVARFKTLLAVSTTSWPWSKNPAVHKLSRGKKLVMAIRPRYVDLAPFLDPRPNEVNITKEFSNICTWTCILNGTGLPLDPCYQLVDSSAEAGIPPLPETLGISYSGIKDVEARAFWWSTATELTKEQVESSLLRTSYFVQGAINVSSPAG
jgi:hypothetical protein